jgi:D-amino-acid dehydrogenase
LLDAEGCRRHEPGLDADTPLQAGIRLAEDGAGNCRQFAQLLRLEAERHGAHFRFAQSVQRIEPGDRPRLSVNDAAGGPTTSESFDAVVVCAGIDSGTLLRPLGLRLPLAAVHGYSITAPLRQHEAYPDLGPRSALMDEKYKVAITRLGQRLRVAGSAEIGGTLGDFSDAAMRTLYRVLNDWFPGAADLGQVQRWKGARPMLPDGPPLLGASGRPGVWLNLGHGSSGWALACGSARVLADALAGRTPEIDTTGLGLDRLA